MPAKAFHKEDLIIYEMNIRMPLNEGHPARDRSHRYPYPAVAPYLGLSGRGPTLTPRLHRPV